MSTEEHILNWLAQHDEPEAKLAAAWIKSFNTIAVRYAEFTGDHINQDDMNLVLSEECFGSAIEEREALWRANNEPR